MGKLVKRYYSTVIMLLFLLVAWEVGTRFFDVPSYILPPPSHILHSFFVQFPLLMKHTVTTLAEVGLGIALGVTGGIGLAIAIFYSPTIERTTYPLIIASQMIPVFAIAPLLVLWFGYGIWPKAIVAALIVFFPIVVNTVDGLRSVRGEIVDLLHSLKASRRQIFFTVRLPASLPSLFSGLKVGVTLSVVGATIGEWIGSDRGLGYLMIHSNALLRVDLVFAAILALSMIGLLLFVLVRIMETRLLRWQITEARELEQGRE